MKPDGIIWLKVHKKTVQNFALDGKKKVYGYPKFTSPFKSNSNTN